MPGAAYNRDAVKARHVIRQMLDVLFDLLLKNIVSVTRRLALASSEVWHTDIWSVQAFVLLSVD